MPFLSIPVNLDSSAQIRCKHPLVYRGMLDIETISTVQFSYYKRGRNRPSKSILNGGAAAPAKKARVMPPENKTRVQPKRRGATTVATAIPRSPDFMSPVPVQAASAAPVTAASSSMTARTPVAATPNHDALVSTPSPSSGNNVSASKKFPFILARLMQQLDQNDLASLIHWNPAGTAILLRTVSVSREEEQKLQSYFAHGSVPIIKRQFDHYQFQKTKHQE